MANLDLDAFKKASDQVLELGTAINAATDIKYAQKRDIRKAAQLAKVEAQNLRVAANALGKKK